jgi:hypothetical protein
MRALLSRFRRKVLTVVDAYYAQENGAYLLLEDGTNIIAE